MAETLLIQTMKLSHLYLILTLPLVTLLTIACQTAGSRTGQATAATLRDLSDQITEGQNALDQTMANLNALVNSPNTDLRPQYRTFSSSLDRMNAVADEINQTASELQVRGSTYFPQWRSEIASIRNEDLRSSIAERQEELQERFRAMLTEFEDLRSYYRPLARRLNDIETALANDLTPAGLDVVRPAVERAYEDAEEVRDALNQAAAEFSDIAAELSPQLPANEINYRGNDNNI